ncbi:MAG TPA: aldolase [Acidobacteriota bacterium]|nr:aldolase [Acidobacteriota bacterium]
MKKNQVQVPADVPRSKRSTYVKNFELITQGSNRLMLFAGDQRVEHLNDDFFGDGITIDDATPQHLFNIASQAHIGVFAAQLGMVAKYGPEYPRIPYLIKLNSKSNIVKTNQIDPYSYSWYDVEQVVEFAKNSGLKIPAVGYTIYLGSEYESQMLREAAQIVYKAHQHGLVTVIWIYPRGKAVLNEKDPHLIAGACDVACALGSDFVKVNYPVSLTSDTATAFKEAVAAAGKTKVICAGGSSTDVKTFLEQLFTQIHTSGAAGNATGRNIHQKPLDEAIRFCNAISAITIDDRSVDDAYAIFLKKK